MALIKCPECGHMISEYAENCIFCGCPMKKIKELSRPLKTKKAKLEKNKLDFYSKLNESEKKLVNELLDYINRKNSDLIRANYINTFGFRKKGRRVLVISFKKKSNKLVFHFKSSKKSETIRINKKNLENIKEKLDLYFFLKKELNNNHKRTEGTFLEKRRDYEQYLIKEFSRKMIGKIPELVIKEGRSMHTYRVVSKDDIFTLCWFSNGAGNKLAFKYYERNLEGYKTIVLYPISKDVDSLVDKVMDEYIIRRYKNDNEEESEEENLPSCELYELIIKGFKKKLSGQDNKTKIANEVCSFVMNEIESKAIEQHLFPNKESFRRYKYTNNFTPNLFGYSFSLRNTTMLDARTFYNFYKTVQVIDKIREYERLFNETIISNFNVLIHDLFEIVVSEDLNFGKARGLSSGFKYVPQEELERIVEDLKEMES